MHPPFLHLDPPTGHLQLGPGVIISEKTVPADLPGLFPAATITPYNLGNGWQHYHVRTEQEGWLIVVVLVFIGRYLIEWQLVFGPAEARPRTWADWDEAAERQLGDRLHAWLRTQLGPAQRQFDWGEVRVGYEARSGGSSVLVRYGGPEPTPPPA